MNAAVFLDRDNTIIHNDGDLGDPEAVVLIKGAATAIASLCGLGYKVIVVTNQGGVARGKYGEEDVARVHHRLSELVEQSANGARVHGFYFCPYHPQGKVAKYKKEHPNRKPQPGMLLQAAEEHQLDLGQSWMVGDQMRDVQAGAAAGCRTILVREDADRLSPLDMADQPGAHRDAEGEASVKPDFMAATLVDAVRIIAQQRKPESAEASRSTPGPRRWDAAAVARLQRSRQAPEPEEDDGDAPGQRQEPRKPLRPFRPWNAPEATDEPRLAEPRPARRPRPELEPEPAQPAPPAAETSEPAPDVGLPPRAPEPADAAPSVNSEGSYKTLRLILQELRAQRSAATHQHHGGLRLFALVLQIIAGVCVVAALWMGSQDADVFVRWIGVAVIVQLGVITALLFARQP